MKHTLTHNSYGKSAVRLTKVVRKGAVHYLFEIDAAIQLEGDFTAAYADGDNTRVIATDTIKNTVYVLAKENAFDTIEAFAVILAKHFLSTYDHVTLSTINLTQTAWTRLTLDGQPHAHAFTSAGPQLRTATAIAQRDGGMQLVGGIKDLLVLKTTGSEWRDFHRDRYRTLKDTSDRILATKINATWTFTVPDVNTEAAFDSITGAILRTVATEHSLGVQQTLLQMGEAALDACGDIGSISFELPNQHRIPFNLEPFGLAFEQDIFVATDEPYGLITGTITRK